MYSVYIYMFVVENIPFMKNNVADVQSINIDVCHIIDVVCSYIYKFQAGSPVLWTLLSIELR